MTSKLLLFLITFHPALVYSAESSAIRKGENYIPSVLSDVLRLFSLNQKCLSRGLYGCLQFKMLKGIDRVMRTTDILEVTRGVYFIRNSNATTYNRSDARAFSDRNINIKSFLIEKLREFLKTHLLQISLPTVGRSLSRIGRKKPLKKLGKGGLGVGLFFALALSGVLSAAFNVSVMVGTVVMPVIIGGIAFIAVLIAKIAFVLAGVAGVKTAWSDEKPEKIKIIVKEPIDYEGGWGKHLQGKETSQNLVYSSYVPENLVQSGYQFPH